ncbi:hypothetical protein PIB30_081716 [Stylosanthes scabra]|uniref:Uncharacterized protein n=1 Tax=Stylosanthes scabra TaxID=79078 RepID=A0ABU6UQM7_9FABA|nr:hypothetical protein [Stylosanthes scabra]
MAYPYVAYVIDRKRVTRASHNRKPRVNQSSGSKVIASGSWRGRRKNWLRPILQPTVAQFSLIPSRKRGMKWLRCVGSSLIYSFNEWQSRNFAVWSGSGQTFSESVRFRAQDIIYSTTNFVLEILTKFIKFIPLGCCLTSILLGYFDATLPKSVHYILVMPSTSVSSPSILPLVVSLLKPTTASFSRVHTLRDAFLLAVVYNCR